MSFFVGGVSEMKIEQKSNLKNSGFSFCFKNLSATFLSSGYNIKVSNYLIDIFSME